MSRPRARRCDSCDAKPAKIPCLGISWRVEGGFSPFLVCRGCWRRLTKHLTKPPAAAPRTGEEGVSGGGSTLPRSPLPPRP